MASLDLCTVEYDELDLVVAGPAGLAGGHLAVQLQHTLLDLLELVVHSLQYTHGQYSTTRCTPA